MNALRTALAFGLAVVAGGVAFAQGTTRVSVDSSGAEANSESSQAAISADGRFISFWTRASNLVQNDTNAVEDVFVHDRLTGIIERVSVDSLGAEANSNSIGFSISSNGRVVAFQSGASNLVAGDTNGASDVFVHDRLTGLTERVSVDSSGVEGNGPSGNFGAQISADGQVVLFQSDASNLVAGDTNRFTDVFVHDRVSGLTERVSLDSMGAEGDALSRVSWTPSLSADGQIVAFDSYATNLVSGDTNGQIDAFVRDRSTGITERVSVDSFGAEADLGGGWPSISADGQVVAFSSSATNLISGDSNSLNDVFVHDRLTGLTERVSVDSSGVQANGDSVGPSISGDGQFVAFYSNATNLVVGDTNGFQDVFVHDRSTGLTDLVSVDSLGADGNNGSNSPALSEDGRIAAFESAADNFVAGDTNGKIDIFVRERSSSPPPSWWNYGTGFPGTHGVPTLTSESDPVLGTTVMLDLANSFGRFTAGLLFIGFQEATIHSS